MKKFHDIIFNEYQRAYIDTTPRPVPTGDEDADRFAFLEKGKLSTFFAFNLSLCFDVHLKLLDFCKGISERSEKKVLIFTQKPLAEFVERVLAAEVEAKTSPEMSEEEKAALARAMKGYKGRNLYIENSCRSIRDVVAFLEGRDDIEAVFIERYCDLCKSADDDHISRGKEDMRHFRMLANCAERNDISIFLQTEYDDIFAYNTVIHTDFVIDGELCRNPAVNIVDCDFADDKNERIKMTRSITDKHLCAIRNFE